MLLPFQDHPLLALCASLSEKSAILWPFLKKSSNFFCINNSFYIIDNAKRILDSFFCILYREVEPLIITKGVAVIRHEQMILIGSSSPEGTMQISTLKPRIEHKSIIISVVFLYLKGFEFF